MAFDITTGQIFFAILNEAAGTTSGILDSTGVTGNGSITNGGSIDFEAVAGHATITRCLRHTGSVSGADVSFGNITLDEDSDWTMAFWMRHFGTGAPAYPVNTHTGIIERMSILLNPADRFTVKQGQTSSSNFNSASISNDGWHHHAFCHDASADDVMWWMDASFEDKDISFAPSNYATGDTPLRLFERGGADYAADIALAHVRLYNRMLAPGTSDTDGNIAGLFNWAEPSGVSSMDATSEAVGDAVEDAVA